MPNKPDSKNESKKKLCESVNFQVIAPKASTYPPWIGKPRSLRVTLLPSIFALANNPSKIELYEEIKPLLLNSLFKKLFPVVRFLIAAILIEWPTLSWALNKTKINPKTAKQANAIEAIFNGFLLMLNLSNKVIKDINTATPKKTNNVNLVIVKTMVNNPRQPNAKYKMNNLRFSLNLM